MEAYRVSLPLATSSVVSRSSTLPSKGRLLVDQVWNPEPLLDAGVENRLLTRNYAINAGNMTGVTTKP